jgi:hypothetical protein
MVAYYPLVQNVKNKNQKKAAHEDYMNVPWRITVMDMAVQQTNSKNMTYG